MKEESADSQESDPTPDSDFASVVETETNKGKRASKRKADDPDHKKSYRRSWRSASPLTKLMIYFTGMTALATLLYMSFTGWQLYEIRSGSDETRKLAQSARDSADAAQRQANIAAEQLQAVRDSAQAAKDSARAASASTEQNKELIKAAQMQANTSQVAARAAESSARIAAESQRPSIEIAEVKLTSIEEGKSPAGKVSFRNIGTNPARDFTAVAAIAIAGEDRLPDVIRTIQPNTKATVIVLSRGGFPVNVTVAASFTLTPEYMQFLKTKAGFIYLYVYGSYRDSLTRKRTDFENCWRYDVDRPTEIPFCAMYNTAKETPY
jgi:hypothetical protein